MKDPVCGMEVEKNTSFKSNHDGKTYYFCNPNCQKEFMLNPRKYI